MPEHPDQILKDEHWQEIADDLCDRGLTTALVDTLQRHAVTPRTLAHLDYKLFQDLTDTKHVESEQTSVQARDAMTAIRVLNEWGHARVDGLCCSC